MNLSDIQGLVFHSYRRLPFAGYVMLRFERNPAAVRRWLSELVNNDAIDSATPKEAGLMDRPGVRLNVAFSHTGLAALGLDPDALQTFPQAFVEGLGATWANGPDHRSRALGDVDGSAPHNWDWGYHNNRVDAMLLVFATEEADLKYEIKRWTGEAIKQGAITAGGWKELFGQFPIDDAPVEEPFGFVDGISQPVLRGARGLFGENDKPTQPAIHTLADGEILLGHVDGARQVAASPTVADKNAPLPVARDHPERRDLGYNGTYLVFRQLEQDVDEFKKVCAAGALATNIPVDRFKALLVGRWEKGSPLVKCPIAHDGEHAAAPSGNDFEYRDDPHGERCPVGSHIRRANPRDSLGDNPDQSWRVSNRHRILRRGRPYWGAKSGLHFICLNASIERQFEFIQQNWTNDATFGGLDSEDDPIAGARDTGADWTVTLPPPAETRFRRRVNLPGLARFVTVRGGAYFFLPSLTALRYLAHLPAATPKYEEWVPTPQRLNRFEWIRFAFLVRFPILLAAVLGLAPISLMGDSALRTIVHPMFLMSRPRDMLIVSVLASLAASLAMLAYRVVVLHAEARFGITVPPSRALTWKRVLIWQAYSLPIVLATLWHSANDAVVAPGFGPLQSELIRFGRAALGGYAFAFLILLLAEIWRKRIVRPDNAENGMMLPPMRLLAGLRPRESKIAGFHVVRLVEGYVARFPPGRGAGYFERDTGRILPGHITAAVLGSLITGIYLSGWWVLWPPSEFQLPPMAYSLFVLSIAGSVAAAVAFFLDWFRVPLLTLLVASWIAATFVGGSDHKFAVLTQNLSAAPTVREAINSADSFHSRLVGGDSASRPIVVVAAGGGGAHQAAWTARVLTGLTKLWGTSFTGNLRLISGASAGSVGAMHFVRQFRDGPLQASTGGDGDDDGLQSDVVEAAKAGATGDVWWGITYPDLTRTLWPIGAFVPGTLDRGRSLELAWCHAMKLDRRCVTPTMGDWQADVASGWRPAVAFNAMVVETGQRAVLATYGFPAGSETKDLAWLTGGKDLPVMTAARLAATFPYITAVARPDNDAQKVHLIDGGYWDNYGVVTVLEWLAEADLKGRKILVVRIPPPPEPDPPPRDRAWPWQTIAPLQAGLSMRTNAQQYRNDFEIKLFQGAHKLDIVWAEFPYQHTGESTDTLLSWHLSRKERCGIETVWNDKYGRAAGASPGESPKGAPEINKVASVLGTPAAWVAPDLKECTP